MGVPKTPGAWHDVTERDTLSTKIEKLLAHVRELHERSMNEKGKKHELEISKMLNHIQRLNKVRESSAGSGLGIDEF